VNPKIRKYGLLGYPLGHSLSDYIHRRIFEMSGLADECEYKLYEVSPDELSLKGGVLLGLSGFNVTIPYKTEIVRYLDRLDTSATAYGAVNCVKVFERDGKNEYVGYNTDGYGFLKAIEVLGAPLKVDNPGTRVLLLGCGGTARMMAIEAIKAGADLTVAIRHDKEEEKAAAKLSRDISEITGKFVVKTYQVGQPSKMRITYADSLNIVNEYDLLLNATPCGMFPHADEMPLNPGVLGRVKYLFDAIYNPYPTKLIEQAEKRGVKTTDGMVMLVHQAVQAEKIWNNAELSESETKKIIDECRTKL
jgi:shikimate dehydrogenase